MIQGGKLMGEGTYGCAFYPHLPCKNKAGESQGLGKIFGKSKDFKEEKQLMNIIKKIDPNNDFTVPFYGECAVNTLMIKEEDKKSSCKKLKTTSQKQLIYRFAGSDLWQYFHQAQEVFVDDFIPLLIPLLRGITSLLHAGYTHTDIKPSNMVYDTNVNKIYLIDFGMLFKSSDFHRYPVHFVYRYYPPEFLLMHSVNKKTPLNAELVKSFMKYFPLDMTAFINQNRGTTVESEVLHFIGESTPDTVTTQFETYLQKLDVYSLGISWLEILSILHRHKALRVRNTSLYVRFIHILNKMSDMNPNTRYTAYEAMKKLQKVISYSSPIQGETAAIEHPKVNKHADPECVKLLGKQIRLKLKEKGLAQYGSKQQMCDRLMNGVKHVKANTFKKPENMNTKEWQDNELQLRECKKKLCKEIKDMLKSKGLAQYGNKQTMCERLIQNM